MNKLMPLLTILLMFTISSVLATEQTEIYNHDVLGEVTVTYDKMGPTEFFIKSAIANFQPFAISVSPAAPLEGDRVSVTWFGATNDCNIQYSYLILQKQGTSSFFDVYYTEALNGGSLSASITADFQNAPPAGIYIAELQSFDSNGVCFSESKQFEVSRDTVICPNDYCESWSQVYRADHGSVEQRTCYEYSGDSCIENTDYQTRLMCDDGYIKQGNYCVPSTDNGGGSTGPGNGTTDQCQNIGTHDEYCACYPTAPQCQDDDTPSVTPWYMQGYNFYYIVGIAGLIIVLLIVRTTGGKRR